MDNFKSQDKKIQKLSKVLCEYADSKNISFLFEGHPLKNVDVFGHYGALSLFLIEAEELYEKIANGLYSTEELLLNILPENSTVKLKDKDKQLDEKWLSEKEVEHKFPINYFSQDENTFFSFVPRVSEQIPCDFYLIAHYSHYTLEEYIKKYDNKLIDGKIPLDELYQKMLKKINDGKLKVIERPYVAPAKYATMSD